MEGYPLCGLNRIKEDEQSAIGGITIPFHKGAAAYYAECGIEVPTE